MKHIVGTVMLYTTTSFSGDGKRLKATKENISDAAELAACCILQDKRIIFEVMLSDGSRKKIAVDMTEVGA